MERDRLLSGLKGLNAPDQDMSYHSGGPLRDGPRFDDRTGARLPPDIRPASLTVYGERARFLYDLIKLGPKLADLLEDAKDLAAELPAAEEHCAECGGPCLRRPRHGQGWA
jgi:hypothetical protein